MTENIEYLEDLEDMLTKCNDSIRPCNVGQYILLHYSLHTGMYTVIVFDTEEIQCCVMISVFFFF